MVNFKEICHFQSSRGGPTFSGGSNFFQGGGSNCLFPIETHITCDFPGGGGGRPPVPPSGSALEQSYTCIVLLLSFQFYVSPKLALIGLCIVPPVAIMSRIYGRYLRGITKAVQNSLAAATSVSYLICRIYDRYLLILLLLYKQC